MTVELSSQVKDHRQVWSEASTALALSTGAAVALGFSRFSYGLLLPSMRADLGWTYVQAGALNTANGAGYLIGSLVSAWAAKRLGAARCFIIGQALSVLFLLQTAVSHSFTTLFVVRTLGGVSTAITFILGAGLAAAICPTQAPRWRGTLVGIYVGGVGMAILLSGLVIPLVLRGGIDRWTQGWTILGLVGAACSPVAWWAARRVPEPAGGSLPTLKAQQFRRLAPTFLGYGLFGAGYVGYMTFISALLRSQGGNSGQLTWFWSLLGLVATVSTLFWGRFLGSFHDGRGPALVYAIAMSGTLPVLLFPGPTAMFVSALLFGGSFLAGPTSITIVAQRQLPTANWTAAIALLTAGFSFGQTLGPILAGAVSDATGRVSAGFWVSPALLSLAACVNLMQRPPMRGD